jgi:DNA topoisomerase-1
MQVAQKLYEAGLITYMRTDSVNLSDFALQECQNQITKQFGPDYSKPTKYVTKSKGSQEAHECIRPTHVENAVAGGDAQEKRLYDLIRKRTVASQMAPAEIEKTKARIDISNAKVQFIATGEVIKFDGFLKLYMESNDDDDEQNQEGMLPILKVGEILDMQSILAAQRFKNHPPRYTEASLVKKLEELGIGRPSTYAPTISTIQKRGYVVKEDRPGEARNYVELTLKDRTISVAKKTQNTGAEKQKLFPTDIGMIVTDFLVQHFEDILDYNFTANVEEDFDVVAEGKLQWQKMLAGFYGPFHEQVVKTTGEAERQSGERELGIDPISGKKVITRIGRFGPMVQIGHQDDEEKPRFASVPSGKSISTITLEEALELFALPRAVGTYEGQPMTSAIGRF